MEASNGSAFLPLLAILESLGLEISWFLIRVEEKDKSIEVSDGHHVTAKQKGSVRIQTFDDKSFSVIVEHLYAY